MYECYNCGYTIKDKTRMRHHLDRKRICKTIRKNINLKKCKEIILQGVSYQEYSKSVHYTDCAVGLCSQTVGFTHKEFKCKYCKKVYKHRSTLSHHQSKKCKTKLQEDIFNKSTNELVNILQKQIHDQAKQFNKQIATKDKHINKLISKAGNITNTNNGIIQNNNIIINSYKTPDLSHLTNTDISYCINRVYDSVPHLIKKIYFNENKPENQSLCITNLKMNNIICYDGKDWNLTNRGNIIEYLIDSCNIIFDEYVSTWKAQNKWYLDKFSDLRRKYDKYLDAEGTEELMKRLNTTLTEVIYNSSKNMNIKTFS